MKLKRTAALILALVMSLALVACGGNGDDTSDPNSKAASGNESQTGDTLFAGLPEYQGNGREIKFLVRGNTGDRYANREIIPLDLTESELINDEVIKRNNIVEEEFDVVITGTTAVPADFTNTLNNLINSNTYEYDVVTPILSEYAKLVNETAFYNLKDLKNIRLDGEYWDQKFIKDASINNKLFFLTGHISVLDNECTQCLIFNKTLINQLDLESPYDLVKNEKWTIDKLLEMAKAGTEETDGNPGITSADRIGLYKNGASPQHLFIASGERFITKDKNDIPEISIDTDRAFTVVSKINEFMGNTDASIPIENIPSTEWQTSGAPDVYQYVSDQFGNGMALFRALCLIDLYDLADANVNYGILPLPKFDENQEGYFSNVSTIAVPGYCIPATVEDPETIALILSAMAEASTDTVEEAYYNVLLKNRKFEDNESKEMLDIIFNNRVYDLGVIYDWGGVKWLIDSSTKGGVNTFQSTLESNLGVVREEMETTIEQFQE